MRRQYEGVDDIILTIDGLQPEKGHETLYVVRELTQKRVWFAEPLLSATAPEVQRLIAQAKQWAEILGKRVILWVSDKQDAFVTGIAAEFPEVPHRYCDNHFLRDAAQPVLDADSHAKVQMRKKVRGLRGIERSVLKQQRRQRIKEESQALPQFKFRRFQGGSRAARRVKFPPANRSWRGAGGRDLRPKCHLPCSAEKLGELGDPGFQARLFWKRLWHFFLVADPPQGRQHVGKRWLFLLPVPRSEGKT